MSTRLLSKFNHLTLPPLLFTKKSREETFSCFFSFFKLVVFSQFCFFSDFLILTFATIYFAGAWCAFLQQHIKKVSSSTQVWFVLTQIKKTLKLHKFWPFFLSHPKIQKVSYKNDWIWFSRYKHYQCEWVFLKTFTWFPKNILKIFIDMHFIILYRKILSSLVLNSCYHYKRANIFLIDTWFQLTIFLHFFTNSSQ